MAFLNLDQIATLQTRLKSWVVNLKPKAKTDTRLFYALETNASCVHIIKSEAQAKEFATNIGTDKEREFAVFPSGKLYKQIPSGNIQWGLMLPNDRYSRLILHGDISRTLELSAYLGESNVVYFLRKDENSNTAKDIKPKIHDPSRIQENRQRVLETLGNSVTVDVILKSVGFVDEDFRKRLGPEILEALNNVKQKLQPSPEETNNVLCMA